MRDVSHADRANREANGRRVQSATPGFGADADDMKPAELFWVTKNGIRFTGMPAGGPSRSDQEIWALVAFMLTLPKLSAADYDALDRRVPL